MARKEKSSVLQWFNSNTFHHSGFADIAKLVALKDEQQLKVSVGIPTLNEASNIGNVVETLMPLMEKNFLVDEIAVIDSGSTDATLEIARQKGAKVFLAEKHLKEQGTFFHKGENLWKSLHLLRGDIICWIDADIENIHPRFVYGLVGPILEKREIKYVKSFYGRSVKEGKKLLETGGGRVTEIFARPMLNAFFPELTGFIQPLSGQCAGRRDALESVPFFVGYGVEIGLLIDIYNRFGLESMAQVDLDLVMHRNQPTEALGTMAFALLQVFCKRVPELKSRLKEFKAIYRFPEAHMALEEAAEYFLNEKEIVEIERPPIKGVSEYLLRKSFERDALAKIFDAISNIKKELSGKRS